MVDGCEFLGTVVGKSGFGGMATETARRGALNSVRKRAARLRATHVVVTAFNIGSGVTMQATTMEAKAYKCQKQGAEAPGETQR